MKGSYPTTELNSRPNILEVIGRYTTLRKIGRQYFGLAPCHAEKTPSLCVNEQRQVFYCHSCARGGDAIRFVEMVEGVDFKGALQLLGIGDGDPDYSPKENTRKENNRWFAEQSEKMRARLRELSEQLELADEVGDSELGESIWRERLILADYLDDLRSFENRPDFYEIRQIIEKITRSFC